MLNRRAFVGGLAIVPFMAAPAVAKQPCIFGSGGVAIHGVDPVSYFAEGEPIAGIDRHLLGWRNAIWRFASPDTMAAFERNPHRYAPRYGGFCAVTMARGGISETVPEAWAIHEGRLYLARSVYAMTAWKGDPARYVAQADTHWSNASC
ncbi:YHS domain-containing (seleno)protein [Roseobacter sp. CCS2]|uniref:YHS domain-containing (seleno)protein n=1 Tax=Roseobacter sp. CCS2 TaxID=391593 RepID=UPI0000F3E37A|nr:YHS domain-containing (seleno)protein [Roseobacter sp. CCS2]EBA12758.1 twin-arginine translocation pathway signal sequence domain protein, putative [Roseobacter sp. CCS2]